MYVNGVSYPAGYGQHFCRVIARWKYHDVWWKILKLKTKWFHSSWIKFLSVWMFTCHFNHIWIRLADKLQCLSRRGSVEGSSIFSVQIVSISFKLPISGKFCVTINTTAYCMVVFFKNNGRLWYIVRSRETTRKKSKVLIIRSMQLNLWG